MRTLITLVKDPLRRALMSGLSCGALPLAIMGVRLRVRHHSQPRARGTTSYSVLPELS
jgi:hypothetical protein